MHISATRYLEKGAPRFSKVTKNEEMIKDGEEAEMVSHSKEKNKKKALHKEKRDARTLSLTTAYLSASVSAVSMSGLSVLLLSAFPSASGISVPVPGLSAFLLSAFPSAFGMSVLVPESSALPSMSSVSGVSILVPGLLAPPSVSVIPVLVPGLFPPPFPT